MHKCTEPVYHLPSKLCVYELHTLSPAQAPSGNLLWGYLPQQPQPAPPGLPEGMHYLPDTRHHHHNDHRHHKDISSHPLPGPGADVRLSRSSKRCEATWMLAEHQKPVEGSACPLAAHPATTRYCGPCHVQSKVQNCGAAHACPSTYSTAFAW
jgi:hypothetical protein